MSNNSSGLTDEQKRRIEENRRKALAIKNAKKANNSSPFATPSGLNTANAKSSSSSLSSSNERLDTNKWKINAERNREAALARRDSKRLKADGDPSPYSVSSSSVTASSTSSVTSSSNNVAFAAASSSSRYFPPPTATATSTAVHPQGMSSSLSKSNQNNYNNNYKPKQANNTPQSDRSSHTNQPQQQQPKVAPIFRSPPTRVKISLFKPSRLLINFPFKENIIHEIKNLKTAKYDPKERKWTIDVSDYAKLIEALNKLGGVEIDSDSVPPRVVSLIQSHSEIRDVQVDLKDKFDDSFLDKLYPFQREGIKFGIQRNGRCLIADDMGLGKTVQALGVVAWYRQDWPVLVVAPASVQGAWKNSILKWLGKYVQDYDIQIVDQKDLAFHSKFYISSYERITKHCDEIIRRKLPTIIFDECHNIKSDSALRTKSATKIAKTAKHIILVSGTPALSRPIELYTQLSVLNEKLFTNKHEYGLRYCNARINGYVKGNRPIWDYRGHSNTDELRILLESTIMIRRLKKDVLQDLPSKNRVVVDLKLRLTDEERVELEKCASKCANHHNTYRRDNADLMTWYRETGRLKVPSVLEYLERKISRTGKIICFAHHKVMIDAIADFLNQKKVKHIVITGETMTKFRQELCDDFQENPNTKVALVSIMAAGVGITLTAASLVIFTELSWNPGVLAQAEDRAHRIGQEENVTIEYLISKGTCDEPLWDIIQRKLSVLGKVGLSKDTLKDTATRDSDQSLIKDYFSKVVEEASKEDSNSVLVGEKTSQEENEDSKEKNETKEDNKDDDIWLDDDDDWLKDDCVVLD